MRSFIRPRALVAAVAAIVAIPGVNRTPLGAQAAPSDPTGGLLADYKWRNIGPGSAGGRITDVDALDTDFRYVIAAAASGGVWEPPYETGPLLPKKHEGGCGSLWDALKYEKRIEMAGVEPGMAWYDGRGWGTLVPGTLTQFPVPARELEVSRLPGYTYGGAPGSVGSSSAPNYNACPVALPRCS